jgi:hypothetical protein|tara:strand:+ start:133 stop:486 length:354 start_codon:yes stop_codon:yes gene_type:complete
MDKRSFLVGLIFLFYGLISLLDIEILEFLFEKTIEESLILFGGIYLLFTLFKGSINVKLATLSASLILIFIGLFPLLVKYRILNLNFVPILDVSQSFLEIVIIVFGIYTLVDSLYLN